MTKSHSAALRTLVSRPRCTDAVVESLEAMATTGASAEVLNDLAASYYVRAQRNDQPSDLVRALDAVQRAVAADPRLPAARFNVALMQEAFGLSREAMASWDEFARTDHSPWATEAIEHRKRLANELANAAAIQWPVNRRRLSTIATADGAAIATLIAPYPAAAQRYVEEELLPQWAKNPKTPEAERALKLAEAIAEALARQTNDPYLRDAVATIRKAEGDRAKVTTLCEAHIAFGKARGKERALEPQAAADFYENAERLFARAGSPVQGEATVGKVTFRSFLGAEERLPLLDPVEQEAARRGYHGLLAGVYWARAYLLMDLSRFVESIAQYDEAIGIDQRIHDEEGLANAHVREIGLLRTVGQNDAAWREIVLAHRYAPRLIGVGPRHLLLGETTGLAQASGYPRIALMAQNDAVRMVQYELANTPPNDAETIAGLQKNLAIALRGRAEVEVSIEDDPDATRDIDESMRLVTSQATSDDESMRNTLLARIDEVNGRRLLPTDPDRAVEAFSDALRLALPNEFRTLRATILAERAAAYRRAGRKELATRDLEASLREIRAEESSILEKRAAGSGEELWSGYFARFRPTYEELIRQLVADGQPAEAFAYWEKALAFEPLNLVTKQQLPNDFRRFLGTGEMVRLPRIQAALPDGTILISFTVMNDQTLVWILSHDRFQLLTLPLLSAQRIDAWTKTLQRAERHHDAAAFEAALDEPSAALMGPVLAAIRPLAAGGTAPRLVFIPDRSIHALPLTALRDPATKRRVIEDAPVAIAGSSTLYIFSLMRDRDLKTDETPRALLVGDPAFDRQLLESHGVDRLPLARREVDRIGELYGPQAEVRVDGDATVPDFLERAQRSAVVHLAGHAIANPDAPSHSLLLLAPSPHQSGALTAKELLTSLRLQKTRLFVLSACSSAGGVPIGPEGLAPLVRPLIAAGVPGVIGTLWNVQDGTAEELMVGFHRHYREGHDAAVALQLAQLELMRSPKPGLRSVRAWASFQVIGYASSPFPSLTKSGRRDLQ